MLKNDWVCDLCLYFGQNGKFIPCIFCPNTGGALKSSDFPLDSKLFSNLNPNFYEYFNKQLG